MSYIVLNSSNWTIDYLIKRYKGLLSNQDVLDSITNYIANYNLHYSLLF